MSKQLNTRILNKYDTTENWNNATFVPYKGELIIYAEGPKIKFGNGVDIPKDLPFATSEEISGVYVHVPFQKGTLTYNKTEQYPDWENYDSTKIDAYGIFSAKNAGTYSVIFSPKKGFIWSDGTSEAKKVTWHIEKANHFIDMGTSDRFFVLQESTSIFGDPYTQTGPLTRVESSDPSAVDASFTSDSIVVVGKKFGNYSITYEIEESRNYKKFEGTMNVTVGCKLDQYTWEEISDLSYRQTAKNYFSIGDSKQIVLNSDGESPSVGTNGYFSGPFSTCVYILGFDQDTVVNMNFTSGRLQRGITFGCFKHFAPENLELEQSGGLIDICLADSYYLENNQGLMDSLNENEVYSFTFSYIPEEDYSGAAKDWGDSDVRRIILGSDGGISDMTYSGKPVPAQDTLLHAFPSDLLNVMKRIMKWHAVTTYSAPGMYPSYGYSEGLSYDYLPLMSAYQLTASTSYPGGEIESATQERYEYYRLGNSKTKYVYYANKWPSYNAEEFSPGLWLTSSGYETSYVTDTDPGVVYAWDSAKSELVYIDQYRGAGLAPVFVV